MTKIKISNPFNSTVKKVTNQIISKCNNRIVAKHVKETGDGGYEYRDDSIWVMYNRGKSRIVGKEINVPANAFAGLEKMYKQQEENKQIRALQQIAASI